VTLTEVAYSLNDLPPRRIAGPCIKWRYCRSRLRSSHCCNVGIINNMELKSTNVGWPPLGWWLYQVSGD